MRRLLLVAILLFVTASVNAEAIQNFCHQPDTNLEW